MDDPIITEDNIAFIVRIAYDVYMWGEWSIKMYENGQEYEFPNMKKDELGNFLRGKTVSNVIRLVLGSNINEENNPIIIRYLNKIVQDTTATNTYALIAKLTKRVDELEKIVSDLNDKLNHS